MKTLLQVIGTAMGISSVPTYANLFLASFEGPMLEELKDIILFYRCFIDDIFSIIIGTMDDVCKFRDHFGSLHLNMRIEWTWSRYSVPFLDVQVLIKCDPASGFHNPHKRLSTNVYQKALNAYLYTPWNSCHSTDPKHACVKGELIHYVQLCSKEADFANIHVIFAKCLSARGYPGHWLPDVFEEVKHTVEHPSALKVAMLRMVNCQDVHVLKLTYNPVWDISNMSPVWHDLNDAWKESGFGYPDFRFMALYAKPVALGDQLNIHNHDTFEEYHCQLA
jgi:hypothetical protein